MTEKGSSAPEPRSNRLSNFTGTVTADTWGTVPTKLIGVPICPDLLEYDDLGAADNLRGRVVRGFFWLIRWWR